MLKNRRRCTCPSQSIKASNYEALDIRVHMCHEYVHRLPVRNVCACDLDVTAMLGLPRRKHGQDCATACKPSYEFSGPLSPLADTPVMSSLPNLLKPCRAGWGTLSGDTRQRRVSVGIGILPIVLRAYGHSHAFYPGNPSHCSVISIETTKILTFLSPWTHGRLFLSPDCLRGKSDMRYFA